MISVTLHSINCQVFLSLACSRQYNHNLSWKRIQIVFSVHTYYTITKQQKKTKRKQYEKVSLCTYTVTWKNVNQALLLRSLPSRQVTTNLRSARCISVLRDLLVWDRYGSHTETRAGALPWVLVCKMSYYVRIACFMVFQNKQNQVNASFACNFQIVSYVISA